MKAAKAITIAAVSAMLASCDTVSEIATDHDNWYFTSEEDCECNNNYLHSSEQGMPESGEVTIRVSSQQGGVRVLVYNGQMDGGSLAQSFTATEQRSAIELPVNKNYTYVAEYIRDSDTIMVPVNSKFKCNLNECKGRQCYFFINNVVDLRLKF